MLIASKKNERTLLGYKGEQFVATWLQEQGFAILEKNYRKKSGEIDLIAHRKELIIFVEVKTRLAAYFNLSTVVTEEKQRKIILTARSYLAEKMYTDYIYRFDLALLQHNNDAYDLTYIPNAFTAQQAW